MDSATAEYQAGWRNKTKEYFSNHEVICLDPCRRPHVENLTPKEIFNLDVKDLHDSDLLLYDYRNDGIPQFGSPSEIMYFSVSCS